MEFNLLQRIRNSISFLKPSRKISTENGVQLVRELNEISDPNIGRLKNFVTAFFGGSHRNYNYDKINYVKYGYNHNPIVYSVISQMANKTSTIPFYIKEINEKKSFLEWQNLERTTKRNLTVAQEFKKSILESKAFNENMPLPLDRPNPLQTWTEFLALYKTYLKISGEVFIWKQITSIGLGKGEPRALYILPSHLMNIIIRTDKTDTFNMMDVTNISKYMLKLETQYIEFDFDEIIHIKYANPNFDFEGSHLYGISPLKSALRNIESSNLALDLNIKTLKNGGAFGFLHAKKTPLNVDQAKEIKERLLEMERDPGKLSKIAGVSTDLGFTRISLTTDELKPFDYLKFDTKQICNVLAWSDKLLNNDEGAKYDNVLQFRKWVVTDNIMPDLDLLADSLNKEFLPLFKQYKGAVIVFDATELPEMQTDTKELSEWLNNALDRGVITRNEYRDAVKFTRVDDPLMDAFTVQNDILTIQEAFDNSTTLN